jgi:hypothetical protein
MGSRRWLWQILFALSQTKNDAAAASPLRPKALEIISYIAEHTPLDYRDTFLGLSKVRAVVTA